MGWWRCLCRGMIDGVIAGEKVDAYEAGRPEFSCRPASFLGSRLIENDGLRHTAMYLSCISVCFFCSKCSRTWIENRGNARAAADDRGPLPPRANFVNQVNSSPGFFHLSGRQAGMKAWSDSGLRIVALGSVWPLGGTTLVRALWTVRLGGLQIWPPPR